MGLKKSTQILLAASKSRRQHGYEKGTETNANRSRFAAGIKAGRKLRGAKAYTKKVLGWWK